MNIKGVQRLARDSRRAIEVKPIERLEEDEVRLLIEQRFGRELELSPNKMQSLKNIELLHRRLDDAIILLTDRQSGGNATLSDVEEVLIDIYSAMGGGLSRFS